MSLQPPTPLSEEDRQRRRRYLKATFITLHTVGLALMFSSCIYVLLFYFSVLVSKYLFFYTVCLRFIVTWACSIHLLVSVCNLATDILWKDREEPNFAPQKNGETFELTLQKS